MAEAVGHKAPLKGAKPDYLRIETFRIERDGSRPTWVAMQTRVSLLNLYTQETEKYRLTISYEPRGLFLHEPDLKKKVRALARHEYEAENNIINTYLPTTPEEYVGLVADSVGTSCFPIALEVSLVREKGSWLAAEFKWREPCLPSKKQPPRIKKTPWGDSYER
jgi:hypothetical protein